MMKVHFDGVTFESLSGPSTFANRLARAIFESGNELVDSGTDADVSLVFIEPTGRPLAPRVIQRLDGVWFKPSEYQEKNRGIRGLYNTADLVIWQSDFDRRMTTKWWGDRAGETIHNGIEDKVHNITVPGLVGIRKQYEKIFVCSANWHPQKRLTANIAAFKHFRSIYPNSCLIIMGANPDVSVADPHIYYTGSLAPEIYMQIYAAADWMLHLAWADHCPNVVVEALSQKVPVICSEVGGTKELVEGYGLIIKETPYNFELYDYDNPPTIDVSNVLSLPDRESLGDHLNIDINNVLCLYLNAMKSVI